MDNIFSEFNKEFFKSVKNITWYDQSGVMELDNNKIVIFRFLNFKRFDSILFA